MSRFSHPYARQLEAVLLQELRDGGTVRSLGVLYGLLMAASRYGTDQDHPFQPVNRAIIDATDGKPDGRLDRIKKVGHRVIERAAHTQSESSQ